MRKIVKKGMALASATIMIAGSMPMTAVRISATENDGNQIAVQAEQDIAVQADSKTASGTWGTCEWTYDNGTLTIGGGVGKSTSRNISRPWHSCGTIEKVVITDQITFEQNTKLDALFLYQGSLKIIDGLNNLDTSNVVSMDEMFGDCTQLEAIDVSGFDTSNVENMSFMFWNCIKLKNLDLSSFNTGKVKEMYGMFSVCEGLSTIDISGFDTSNVENMESMFYSCRKLQNLDLSNFDTSKVKNMKEMFCFCNNLESLNIRGFDTSNVTNMNNMFYWCKSLHTLDISNFDLTNATNFEGIIEYSTIGSIKLPDKMGNNKDAFLEEIKNSMLSGKWKDETSGIMYDDKDSLIIEGGHAYVYYPEKMKVILNHNIDDEKKIVRLSVVVEGGVSDYNYRFIMYNPVDDECIILKDYATYVSKLDRIYTWHMVGTGKRIFYVDVKDALGNVVRSEAVTIELPEDQPNTIEEIIKNNNLGYTVNKDSSGTQLLTGVKPAFKADTFKTSFGTNITVKSTDGTELVADAAVGTGCVVELIQDKRIVDTATVVVKGDTDGSGSIDVLDMEAIQKSILGIGDKLSGAYKEAASLTDGDDITVLDMEAIQKDILGIQKIN